MVYIKNIGSFTSPSGTTNYIAISTEGKQYQYKNTDMLCMKENIDVHVSNKNIDIDDNAEKDVNPRINDNRANYYQIDELAHTENQFTAAAADYVYQSVESEEVSSTTEDFVCDVVEQWFLKYRHLLSQHTMHDLLQIL